MKLNPLVVYCADIGSIKKGNFGWAREDDGGTTKGGADISKLVGSLAADVKTSTRVALGFECPLYVPIPDDPSHLTSQRPIDRGKPWSAGAGASALATGLTETVWILQQLRNRIHMPPPAFLSWEDFKRADQGLFLWEAMVVGEAKGNSHQDDAAIAVRAFREWALQQEPGGCLEVGNVHSLIGAALLRSCWSTDLSLLEEPCLVIRP